MKTIIRQLSLLLCLLGSASVAAQVSQSESPRIQVMVMPLATSPAVRDILYSHFSQAVSLNEMSSADSRFVLVVRPLLLASETIARTPPQVMSEVELNFFLVDGFTKRIVTAHSIKLTGIEGNEKRAVEDAVNALQPRDPAVKRFLTRVKEQLLSDYSPEERTRSMRLTAQVEQELTTLITGR